MEALVEKLCNRFSGATGMFHDIHIYHDLAFIEHNCYALLISFCD